MHNAPESRSDSETRTRLVLDVRADISNGREPFSKIMSAVAALPTDQDLCLLAPFEPVPLFAVLKRKGFCHSARQLPSGDWEVVFSRVNTRHDEPLETTTGACPASGTATSDGLAWPFKHLRVPTEVVHVREQTDRARTPSVAVSEAGHAPLMVYAEETLEVDARGLEPPQPMVRILEALATLPPAAKLHAITDRRPLYLYAQLEARGFTGRTEERANGGFLTRIERNGVENGRAVES